MNAQILINLGSVFGVVLWMSTWVFFFNDATILEMFAPSANVILMYVVVSITVFYVRSSVLKITLLIWVLWPVFGTYFSISHYFQQKLWAPISLHDANVIYMSNIIALAASVAIFERILPGPYRNQASRAPLSQQWTLLDCLPLLLFPVVFLFSMVMTGPTILSGQAIVEQMYSIDRGMLYGFRLVMVFTCCYLTMRIVLSKSNNAIMAGFILFTLFVSVIDGKRDMAIMISLCSMFTYIYVAKNVNYSKISVGLVLVIIGYGIISSVRSGRDAEIDGLWGLASIAGVEYRDFAYSITYWSPEYIKTHGYDFFRSSIAMLVNGSVLEAFGVDKVSWVNMDSARSWQRAIQAEVGIRVGLVAELHYAVGRWSLICFFILGILLVYADRVAMFTRQLLPFMMAVSFLASIVMAAFSQSSATFGYILTTIYIFSFMMLWKVVVARSVSRARPLYSGSYPHDLK